MTKVTYDMVKPVAVGMIAAAFCFWIFYTTGVPYPLVFVGWFLRSAYGKGSDSE